MKTLRTLKTHFQNTRNDVANLVLPEKAWKGAFLGLAGFTAIIVLIYFTLTVLAHFSVEKLPAFFVWLIFSAGGGVLILVTAMGLMAVPKSYRWALAVCIPLLLLVVARLPDQSSYLGLALLVLVPSVAGGSIAVLLERSGQKARLIATSGLFSCVVAVVLTGYAIFSEKEPANRAIADYQLDDWTLALPNPGAAGKFNYSVFTYGSGEDRQRAEFAEDAFLISRQVDGSALIDNWDGLSGWLRTRYWGFGPDALPLQARVWMPEGDGPFPLVLVVHGNHGMEDYSDPGYDYLGEHFASRGIILASIDENFINGTYSARVDFFADRAGLQEENDARGWLLLEHLALWRDWNSDSSHPIAGKVDMDRLALIGHSRGGEAVGVAAAFNRLPHYPDDATVSFDFDFNLRGVIAIAPVYGQYEARERPTIVDDVDYFTIHGDMDGDVQTFEGVAQYSRVRFSGDDYRFRSSLYVVGANHGQFNTTWENLDTSPFFAWTLDTAGIMPPEQQRDVARVYFGAFMEAVLFGREDYLPLFKDARYGADWLPSTFFINQFTDSNQRVIVDFEQDMNLLTLDQPGGRVSTSNLTRWFEAGNQLKYDELDTFSLFAAWDNAVNEETAAIRFELAAAEKMTSLILSLSPADMATKPTDWKEENSGDANATDEATEQSPLLDWTVVLIDARGRRASTPLSQDSPLYPLINARPRRADFLDSTDPSEMLFRRFELVVADFEQTDPEFDSNRVTAIEFLFDRSPRGAIALDYIALDTAD